jgi:cysteine synthase A
MAENIADSMLELVGATPMVRLRRMPEAGSAEVVVKLESFNPAGSVKDRVSLAMIEAAERDGRLREGDTIVEPTSGNTGIGLALAAAVKGYRLIITMPDDSSVERRRLLEHYGAQVVLTPARKLMQGAIDRAHEIVAGNPRCFMPGQFDNPANPQAHRDTTAREILAATGRRVDAFVVGVGTGGTITGVGQVLRQELGALLVVAVEPAKSRALSGGATRPHGIEGIGAGFVPRVLDRDVIDEVLACEDATAFATAGRLAREEGISAGMSAGAAVWGALQIATRLGPGKRVVSVIPDAWDRYATRDRPPALAGLDFII